LAGQIALLVTALALGLSLAAPAQAKNDPLGSGTVKLVLDKRFAFFLEKDAIKLSAANGAKRKGRAFVLAVMGGSADPVVGKGEIEAKAHSSFRATARRCPCATSP